MKIRLRKNEIKNSFHLHKNASNVQHFPSKKSGIFFFHSSGGRLQSFDPNEKGNTKSTPQSTIFHNRTKKVNINKKQNDY
jgi:hypothetical protein